MLWAQSVLSSTVTANAHFPDVRIEPKTVDADGPGNALLLPFEKHPSVTCRRIPLSISRCTRICMCHARRGRCTYQLCTAPACSKPDNDRTLAQPSHRSPGKQRDTGTMLHTARVTGHLLDNFAVICHPSEQIDIILVSFLCILPVQITAADLVGVRRALSSASVDTDGAGKTCGGFFVPAVNGDCSP